MMLAIVRTHNLK